MPGPGSNGHRVVPQAPPPVEVLQAQFEQARDANQVALADLERKGMAMDPLSFLHARIDSLIDAIAISVGAAGPHWALAARLAFEQHIAAELAEVGQQATKSQLAQGAAWTPGMIAELARQSGLFRRT